MKKPVGILEVKVVRALKLKKKDLLGASDPYVKINLTEEKLPSKKTTVKHKNLNPEWNEQFTFVVKDPESQVLELTVYDWEQVHPCLSLCNHDELDRDVLASSLSWDFQSSLMYCMVAYVRQQSKCGVSVKSYELDLPTTLIDIVGGT